MSLLSSGRKVIEKSRSVGRKLCVQAVKGMELGKAFIYLDEKGEGWLPLEDFESALLLVLSPGADGQHEEQRGEQSGEHAQQAKQEDQVMMAAQVKDLVASLKRSHMVNPLKDLQSPEIDYNMFIQSFTVIDTLLDQP